MHAFKEFITILITTVYVKKKKKNSKSKSKLIKSNLRLITR